MKALKISRNLQHKNASCTSTPNSKGMYPVISEKDIAIRRTEKEKKVKKKKEKRLERKGKKLKK